MGGYGQKRMRMLVAIALVALILGAVSGVVFRKVMVVKNIVVEGVDDETANTARALSSIRLGQSVFDIDERQIAINLREDGYIKLCSVEVQRPDTVILNLKKRVGVAAFEHLGFTYIVDSELSVLECVGALSDAGVMIVTGAPIQRTPVGMPLNVDATRGDMLKTLLSAVESAGISGDISEINVANEQNLYCVMRGGLVFRLGDITQHRKQARVDNAHAAPAFKRRQIQRHRGRNRSNVSRLHTAQRHARGHSPAGSDAAYGHVRAVRRGDSSADPGGIK